VIASVLVCEYVKHGMTCDLGGLGVIDLFSFLELRYALYRYREGRSVDRG
jgi:hypothetical protein